MYYEFDEALSKVAGHRTLAINRGEKEKILTVKIEAPTEDIICLLYTSLVVQSCIFDLVIGDKNARPDGKMAYKACENASYDTFLQGNYGAGMGATVGKYMGRERSMKSGIGAYAVQLGELKVGAVVTLNALGDIYDIDTDKKIAGALDENGLLFDDETAYFEAAAKIQNMFTGNTTIGTIITNAKLDKTALGKVASMAHNGYGSCLLYTSRCV